MLNKPGFIPPKYRQPDKYERIFENWVAVFITNRYIYHVELAADENSKKIAHSIEILCQGAEGRYVLFSKIPSIKQAMEKLEAIIASDKTICRSDTGKDIKAKKCKLCGDRMVWENPHIPGHYHASSSDIENWPICRDCMIEHCCSTNCLGCEYGKYPDCRFFDMKRYYMSDAD
jgi:hypothetical protein